MRSILLPVVTVLALGSASLAMAAGATTTDGTIKTIDKKAHSVTLSDGSTYSMPKTVKLKAFKVGEKVAVTWEQKGKVNEATALVAVKG